MRMLPRLETPRLERLGEKRTPTFFASHGDDPILKVRQERSIQLNATSHVHLFM